MNPYTSDASIEPNQTEALGGPKGLSTATMIATILMLILGLAGLMGIIGLLVSLASMANAPAQPIDPPPGVNAPTPMKLNAIQIGMSIFDLLISIPLVALSIMVLQRKRFAAVYLAWLALALGLLTIPRGILTYILTPQIMESIKSGILQAQEQQTKGKMQGEDLDMIMQIANYALIGCSGVTLIATFLAYLFAFLQLRKPTTLDRLSS
ncbi:MAG: hypothetical protein NTV29_17850 [Planctomycetota bacterium]|nr:hypothetical protein [Planctomycetota bacterium]